MITSVQAAAPSLRLVVAPLCASWSVSLYGVGPNAQRWADQRSAPQALSERILQVLRSVDQNTPGSTTAADPAASYRAAAAHDGLTVSDPATPPDATSDDRRDAAAALSMEQLVHDHADAVYRVALSVTRDPMLAEDASQDTLIKAWLALPSFRGESPLRNWILRIAHNASISLLRKRREEVRDPHVLPERASHTTVESQVQDRLAIDRFELALRDLDSISRSIVVLREVEGLSYDEICDVLELPMPTVKTRLLRARRQLAIALEGWQP